MTSSIGLPGLIADIGGTNARFALVGSDGAITEPRTLTCSEHSGPDAAAAAYLFQVKPDLAPDRGAFAVASPVGGDIIDMTNHPWTFSIDDVRMQLGLPALRVINDFQAVAMAVPHLSEDDVETIGGGAAEPDAPIAILGPGTGLGVSGLVPAGDGAWTPLATEGGHVTLAATTDREDAVVRILRQKFGHASAERALSGPGLVSLYEALCQLDAAEPLNISPAEITERALDGTCLRSTEALDLFAAFLGTVASDLALSLGARGGVYIAGGIVPKLGNWFAASPFRARFEDKGRFSDYLADIPTRVITHPHPAFLGLAAIL